MAEEHSWTVPKLCHVQGDAIRGDLVVLQFQLSSALQTHPRYLRELKQIVANLLLTELTSIR
jgi:hypothetical protein